jgi:hypothetical protein
VQPQVTCPECSLFVQSLVGIRGPYWQGREEAGRRRSYRVGESRDGAVTVTEQFFGLVHRTFVRWVEHQEDPDYRSGHIHDLTAWVDQEGNTCELPAWFHRLTRAIESTATAVGQDAAARMAAEVLGVSLSSVYRGLGQARAAEQAEAEDRSLLEALDRFCSDYPLAAAECKTELDEFKKTFPQ